MSSVFELVSQIKTNRVNFMYFVTDILVTNISVTSFDILVCFLTNVFVTNCDNLLCFVTTIFIPKELSCIKLWFKCICILNLHTTIFY